MSNSRTVSDLSEVNRSRATREAVEREIRDLIASTGVAEGGRLPAEREFAARFNVSRTTVRQVLDSLEHRGLVVRRRGRMGGTFAAHTRVNIDFSYLAGIPSYLRNQGFRAGAHVVSAQMSPADSVAANALEIETGDMIHNVIRVRLADEVRISIEHARFPAREFPDLLSQALDDSIYELLAQRYGVTIVKAVERLVAVLADEEQARLLGISVGDPLMAIERVTYGADGRPLEYSSDLFRGDRTRVIAWAFGAGQTREIERPDLGRWGFAG